MTEAGILLVIIVVSCAGIFAGRKIRTASDFITCGGKASALITTGAFVGTLLGSQCTLGTAQLAFTFGLSAWWFTLGTGLGCLVLALFYCKKLRNSGHTTQFQILASEYGTLTEKFGAVLCTTGTFISILAQVTACIGFITALYPSVNYFWASVLTVIFMCMYIVMGGTWGAGIAGIVKVILLYGSCIACLLIALLNGEVFSEAEKLLCSGELGQVFTHEEFAARYLSMTARGAVKDYGSCVSVILGILSTQTYMQFLLSAKGEREAKKSLLWAFALVPPIGIAGIFIGVFMRSHYILQSEVNALISAGLSVPDMPVIANTIQVFPMFIMNHVSPVFAGIILGTLLITVISGSSGLLLGISAILTEDIFCAFGYVKQHKLFFSRLVIIITLTIASIIANVFPAAAINDLGFLSMTLRASVVFMPLTCALWLKGQVRPKYVLASVILSPLAAIISSLMKFPIEPLFLGAGVSALLCVAGTTRKH